MSKIEERKIIEEYLGNQMARCKRSIDQSVKADCFFEAKAYRIIYLKLKEAREKIRKNPEGGTE